MKLKCIGGPNDGEYGNTYDDKPRVGERVQVRTPRKFEVASEEEWDFQTELNKPISDSIAIYIVDRDNDGLFLRLA